MYGVRNVNIYKKDNDNTISELSAFSFIPKYKIKSNKNVTTEIIGNFQSLKALSHPNLCKYINISKNRKDRIFIVLEYFDNSLQEQLNECSNITNISRLKIITYQILSALVYLNENGIINRNLSLKTVLIDNDNNVKLDNWGFYEFTGKGSNVSFPIGNPEYYPPELIKSGICNLKVDTWSLGILLIYLYFGELPFKININHYLEELFEAILSLKKVRMDNEEYLVGNENYTKKIEIFFKDQSNDNPDLKLFKSFLLECLEPNNELRPTPSDLLCHEFVKNLNLEIDDSSHLTSNYYKQYGLFSERIKDCLDKNNINEKYLNINNDINYLNLNSNISNNNNNNNNNSNNNNLENEYIDDQELEKLQPNIIFYLWRLAGGDLEYEFIKQELISLPSIYRVRNASQIYYALNDNSLENNINNENTIQRISDPENLFQDKKILLYLDTLISKFNEYKKSNNNNFLISLLKMDNNYFISKNGISQEKDISYTEFLNNNNNLVDFWISSESIKKQNDNNNGNDNKYNTINRVLDNDNNPKDVDKENIENLYNLSVLDKDVIFQYGRIKLFERLLNQFPSSWNEFIEEARLHIPSYLRGKIWAAALGVVGDSKIIYKSLCEKNDLRCNDIDDTSNLELERQLDADIPRCHQYNDLLSSEIGHNKLKKVIKCWNIAESGNMVYWQGLDSVCAPFVALNFNEEEIAFSCLLKFIKKYMYGLFKLDNTYYIQSYLISMSHIITFHDPELGSYLNRIGLTPDIYAIPWFMTMFTHVFPLDKIYMIWDKILTGKPSLPLFIGSAIVIHLRSEILDGDFDDNALLLSELSAINIEKCLEKAQLYLRITPKSIIPKFLQLLNIDNDPIDKCFENQDQDLAKDNLLDDIAIVEDLNSLHSNELAPRIDLNDFKKMYGKSLILDVRNESVLTTSEDNGYIVISPSGSFLNGHIKNSMSVPYFENDLLPKSLINYIKIIHEGFTYVVVVGEEERATKLATLLVNEYLPRVSYLDVNIIKKEIFDSWSENIWCCKKPECEKFYIDNGQDDVKSLDINRNISPVSARSFNSERPFENAQSFMIYKCY